MLMLQKSCTSALRKKVPRLEVSTSLTSNRHTNSVNLSCYLEFIEPTEIFNGFKRSQYEYTICCQQEEACSY